MSGRPLRRASGQWPGIGGVIEDGRPEMIMFVHPPKAGHRRRRRSTGVLSTADRYRPLPQQRRRTDRTAREKSSAAGARAKFDGTTIVRDRLSSLVRRDAPLRGRLALWIQTRREGLLTFDHFLEQRDLLAVGGISRTPGPGSPFRQVGRSTELRRADRNVAIGVGRRRLERITVARSRCDLPRDVAIEAGIDETCFDLIRLVHHLKAPRRGWSQRGMVEGRWLRARSRTRAADGGTGLFMRRRRERPPGLIHRSTTAARS